MITTHSVALSRRALLGVGATLALAPRSFAANSSPLPRGSRIVAENLAFPEGVFVAGNGSFGCVEIADGALSLFTADRRRRMRIHLGGGPNGAAIGPDGAVYVANDGGLSFAKKNGIYSITGVPETYVSGSIQRVDPVTGEVRTLYERAGGETLKGPNDLLFADDQGFWFSDTGKIRGKVQDPGGLYWASIDGKDIRRAAFPLEAPNGVALSPDRKTLYVALSNTRQIMAFDIEGAGRLRADSGRILCTLPGRFILDNLAVEAGGNIVIATVIEGGLLTIDPTGQKIDFMGLPDFSVTAIAFGGPKHDSLYAALSTTGKIISIPWPRRGLPSLFGQQFVR